MAKLTSMDSILRRLALAEESLGPDPSAAGASTPEDRAQAKWRSAVDAVIEEQYLELVRRTVFAAADDETAKRLAASFSRPRRVEPGGIIVEEGEAADSLFVVVSGHVEVYTTQPETGRRTHISVLGHPSVFGEMALLEERGRRVASVAAIAEGEGVELLVLGREAFEAALASCPEVKERLHAHAVTKATAGRLPGLRRELASAARELEHEWAETFNAMERARAAELAKKGVSPLNTNRDDADARDQRWLEHFCEQNLRRSFKEARDGEPERDDDETNERITDHAAANEGWERAYRRNFVASAGNFARDPSANPSWIE